MKKEYHYYVYIMGSHSGTLYIGVTNDLVRRVQEHKEGLTKGFTNKYKCNQLLYFEEGNDVNDAINREKQIKHWRREKKEALINTMNPQLQDLSKECYQ